MAKKKQKVFKCYTEVSKCPRHETSEIIRNDVEYVNCRCCAFSTSKAECKLKKDYYKGRL